MFTKSHIEEKIGLILLFGTLISATLVLLGGILFLTQHGMHTLQHELTTSENFHTISALWAATDAFSSVGIIEFGILTLVATQTLRVALLCYYYLSIKDYYFISISFFVLFVLIYSSFWRH